MVWPAKGEIKNYIVRVDYSSFDTAAICLVRTGKSDAEMTVNDSSGNKADTQGHQLIWDMSKIQPEIIM